MLNNIINSGSGRLMLIDNKRNANVGDILKRLNHEQLYIVTKE